MLLVTEVSNDRELKHLDVEQAFVHGIVDEGILRFPWSGW